MAATMPWDSFGIDGVLGGQLPPSQPRSQGSQRGNGYASGPGSLGKAPVDFNSRMEGGAGVAGVHAVMVATGGEYPVIDEVPQVSCYRVNAIGPRSFRARGTSCAGPVMKGLIVRPLIATALACMPWGPALIRCILAGWAT